VSRFRAPPFHESFPRKRESPAPQEILGSSPRMTGKGAQGSGSTPRARRAAVWRSNVRGCPFMPAQSVQALDRALTPQNRQAGGRPGDRAAARAAPCSARGTLTNPVGWVKPTTPLFKNQIFFCCQDTQRTRQKELLIPRQWFVCRKLSFMRHVHCNGTEAVNMC
jgi:hypothetical protein